MLFLVIKLRLCVFGTPLHSALLSQVYLGNAQRRERNPAGRGDWAQERGVMCFLSLSLFPFFGCISAG